MAAMAPVTNQVAAKTKARIGIAPRGGGAALVWASASVPAAARAGSEDG